MRSWREGWRGRRTPFPAPGLSLDVGGVGQIRERLHEEYVTLGLGLGLGVRLGLGLGLGLGLY